MDNIKATLIHSTPLTTVADTIRTAWQSHDKSDSVNGQLGEADKQLIDRIGNKFKHGSVLESLVYHFHLSGFPRSVLQELARHRMASLTVKSTRYTLKELKSEDPFDPLDSKSIERAKKYLCFPSSNKEVIDAQIKSLEYTAQLIKKGYSNDEVKPTLIESYRTECRWVINARSLQNLLSLRLDKATYKPFRVLALRIYQALPESDKYLFEQCLPEQAELSKIEQISS